MEREIIDLIYIRATIYSLPFEHGRDVELAHAEKNQGNVSRYLPILSVPWGLHHTVLNPPVCLARA